MPTRRRLWVPLVAAVLGAVSGVATALVVADDGGGARAPRVEDPLAVGVPLVDLDCTGQAVFVLGYGSSAVKIRNTVVTHPGEDVRYLRTDSSCATQWAPPGHDEVPEYVAYSGPYDDPAEPCVRRMQSQRDDVTMLVDGADSYVRCFCFLPLEDLPVLEPSDQATPQTAIWVRALQNALIDLDQDFDRGGSFRPGYVTGIFDERTERRVRDFQEDSVDIFPGTGVVDAVTWRALTDTLCE